MKKLIFIILLCSSLNGIIFAQSLTLGDFVKGSGPGIFILEPSIMQEKKIPISPSTTPLPIVRDQNDKQALLIRRLIPDLTTLICMNNRAAEQVKTVDDVTLSNIPEGAPLPSRVNGSILKGSGPAVYLVENCQRRHIPNPETLETLGGWAAVKNISDSDLQAIQEGEPVAPISKTHLATTNFLLQVSSALHPTGDDFDFTTGDWDQDGMLDIFAIKKHGTLNTEVHILGGASEFKQFILQTATALHPTDGNFKFCAGDWDQDKKPDLFIINRQGQGTNSTEVHVLSGASNFQQFILHQKTALHITNSNFEFALQDWDRDGIPDLFVVNRNDLGTNSTAVHILSGASAFQQFILHRGTPLHLTTNNFEFALEDWDQDGLPDLFAVNKDDLGTNSTAVHILSGASEFQQFVLHTGTILQRTNNNFIFFVSDWNKDAQPDLFSVAKKGTGTNATEVHVINLKIRPKLRGFAEIHNHQFANLAFGGKFVAGQAFGPMNTVLSASIDRGTHGPEHVRNWWGDVMQERGLTHKRLYGNEGYPSFAEWPNFREVTHQKVHEEWLYRAVQGGLRLLVMMAVESPTLCAVVHDDGRDCNDEMSSINQQLDAAYAMQSYMDEKAGGTGKGWYRIVKSPAEARQVILDGKLAVVLGIETAHIFGCKKEENCDWGPSLQKYWDKGVRHFFPIHQDDNAFGGASYFKEILQRQSNYLGDYIFTLSEPENPANILAPYDLHTYPTPVYEFKSGRSNSLGLTAEGKNLINALIRLGAIIDVDHMSDRAFSQTLDIVENFRYPVVASHAGFNYINNKNQDHEGQLTLAELKRIQQVGGMIGLITGQGDLEHLDTWRRPGKHEVAHICGGTSETFAQALTFAIDNVPGMAIGVGTDMNTPLRQPGPRFGTNACPGGLASSQLKLERQLIYPFPARGNNNLLLNKCVSGTRYFDYNLDGLAHIGLLPDLFADLEVLGLSLDDLEPVFKSAEGYIEMWERAFLVSKNLSATGSGPIPMTWAERNSGTIFTKDNDQINYVIQPNLVTGEEVEFVLEIPKQITWTKELKLKAIDGIWTISVENDTKTAVNRLYRYQLANGELVFLKKKGLFQGYKMLEVLKLNQLDKLPVGSKTTFSWVKDN